MKQPFDEQYADATCWQWRRASPDRMRASRLLQQASTTPFGIQRSRQGELIRTQAGKPEPGRISRSAPFTLKRLARVGCKLYMYASAWPVWAASCICM